MLFRTRTLYECIDAYAKFAYRGLRVPNPNFEQAQRNKVQT